MKEKDLSIYENMIKGLNSLVEKKSTLKELIQKNTKKISFIIYLSAVMSVISCSSNEKKFILEDGKGLIQLLKENEIEMTYSDVFEYNKENNPEFENIINPDLIPAGTTILIPGKKTQNEEEHFKTSLKKPNKLKIERKIVRKIERELESEFKSGFERMKPYMDFLYEECEKNNLYHEFALTPLTESFFKTNAISRGGAKGAWQIKDDTAKEKGLKNPFDIKQSSKVGLKICSENYKAIKNLNPNSSEENIFKFSVLAYNTGLHRTKALYKFSNGDFTKLIESLKSKSGLKKINKFLAEKGIKKFSNRKAEEVSRYAYKFFAALNVINKVKPEEKEEERESIKQKRSPQNYLDWEKSIEKKNDKLKGVTIVLDTGHGGQERNTAGENVDVPINEHEVCYDITTRLFKLLKESGADVKMTIIDQGKNQIINNKPLDPSMYTPDKDEVYNSKGFPRLNKEKKSLTEKINQRKEIGNKFIKKNQKNNKKSIFISIHADALIKKIRGFHVMVDSKTVNNKDKKLANDILKKVDENRKEIVEYGEYEGFNIKKERPALLSRGLAILKNKKTGKHKANDADANVLIELGNMQNKDDSYILRKPTKRQQYAKTIYEGILNWHNGIKINQN